jgi:DoxX-like family
VPTTAALLPRPTTSSRRREIVYWLVSLPVLAETAAGIQWDLTRHPTVVEALDTIRFPDYMADVLGWAKVLALLALLVPGFARLKEWAYAGVVFVYLGAAACHLAVGDTIGHVLTPAVLGVIALASWALRPASRREPRPLPEGLRRLLPSQGRAGRPR